MQRGPGCYPASRPPPTQAGASAVLARQLRRLVISGCPGEARDTVEFLAGLAGDGPVLELAIGTGRIGLPLAAVDGVEASP